LTSARCGRCSLWSSFLLHSVSSAEASAETASGNVSNLKKNTKIVTIGGLYGVITDIKDDYVRIRIADKVEIKLKKESISAIAGDEED
jgi:preprotein translocase YajC subunit